MTDACYAYARWGALAQVRRLTERYPSLIPVEATAPEYKALPVKGTLAAIDQADLLAFVTALQIDVYKRQVRGWMNYYGRYSRSECIRVLRYINQKLAKWARKKYKPLRKRDRQSEHYLGRLARRRPDLLALWALGVKPPVEKART